MIRLLRRFDPWRLAALIGVILPLLAAFVAGVLWFWQHGVLIYWLIAFLLCGAIGYILQKLLIRRARRLLPDAGTAANPGWAPEAGDVWGQIDAFAGTLRPQDWPLNDGGRLLTLGRQVLDIVSRSYHADADRPVLELTIPHALLIIERASRDLRGDIADNVPFSHQVTIGDLSRVQRWKASAEKWYNVYRVGRAVVNPFSALFSEAWGSLRDHSFNVALDELHGWLLRAYVRRVGYYAIELYSGQLLFDDLPADYRTPMADNDLRQAQTQRDVLEEPARIALFGRSNVGKSSLINALFGELLAATDMLPDTTAGVTPYLLERDGMVQALILDTPGFDTGLFKEKQMAKTAGDADLLLWVTAATRPDRQQERETLDKLRETLTTRAHRQPPRIIVVMTHIDQLRPVGKWQPPYDLLDDSDPKAASIRAATLAVAADLAVELVDVVPVCLAGGRVYNVDDALWTVMLSTQDDVLHARLLRCLESRRRDENWTLLRRQLGNAGRLLLRLPQ